MSRNVAFALLLFGVAWFTAAATAVRSASRIWLRHWAERRLRGSARAEPLLDRPQRLLVTSGAANAVLFFWTGIVFGTSPRTPLAMVTEGAVLVVTFHVFGQLLPRAAGRRWATSLLPVLVLPLRLLDVLVWPVARGVRALVRSGEPRASTAEEAREELQDLLREGELEGVGEREEIELISGVVQFGAKSVRMVMTPRASVFAIDESLPPKDIAREVAQANYSRVPVFSGTLDTIKGMLYTFDILKAGATRLPPLRPVGDAQAESRCDELLYRMLRQRQHLAAVRETDGTLSGIVTLEDLLEELVGEIRDEHDEPAPIVDTSIR